MERDTRVAMPMDPEDEIEFVDLKIREAGIDEAQTAFDPDTAPKPPHPKEEGVTSHIGESLVDLQRDTPLVGHADFDLTQEDLWACECDVL